ncbi:MAG: hypothetical protein PHS79_02515 [Patescibacteria group bacterium]|nr:hypothetical protein [Patescibacteria group bacterium]
MFRLPSLILPQAPLNAWYLTAYIIFSISLIALAFFWIWALIHATRTPRASWSQRLVWGLCLLINPTATIWYWCIWKRWAFWSLFTPLLGTFVALPFVIRSMMTKADATALTNTLFAIGSNSLVILVAVLLIYPIVLRLMVVLHLSKNTALTAMERNDWVLTLAFPLIGFGSALTYAAKNLKPWALGSLAWLVVLAATGKIMITNITPALIPAGDEKREEFKTIRQNLP